MASEPVEPVANPIVVSELLCYEAQYMHSSTKEQLTKCIYNFIIMMKFCKQKGIIS